MSRVKLTAQPYRCAYSKRQLHDFRIFTVDWFALGGGCPLRGSPIFFVRSPHDDLQCVIRNGRCRSFASSRSAHPLARESLPSPNIWV